VGGGFDLTTFAIAGLGIYLVGLSKAGFGGGLGILTTPLAVIAFSRMEKTPVFAIGVVLPLLCAADMFSIYYYRGKARKENLRFLLPGVVVGTIIGLMLIDRFSARQMNVAIGIICIGFVLFQLAKEKIFAAEGTFAPNHRIGIPCGVGAGITSTFANGAGPLVAMYLIPQRMPKQVYVATTALVFAWINWIKVVFFVPAGIITWETLRASGLLLVFVPLGVWTGLWLNQMIPERLFVKFVYAFTFLTGVQLLWR
jgi:uncharacterized membrane protein YfcA